MQVSERQSAICYHSRKQEQFGIHDSHIEIHKQGALQP